MRKKNNVKSFSQQYEESQNQNSRNTKRAIAALFVACIIVIGFFSCLWISTHWSSQKSDQTPEVQSP